MSESGGDRPDDDDPFRPPSESGPPEAPGTPPEYKGMLYGPSSQSGQPPQYGPPQYGQPQYGQPQYGQPAGYGGPPGEPPPNYLVWSILSTIFCCWPLGIVSIVYAAQVNTKFATGDHAGAVESSRKAKQWAIWSAVSLVIMGVLLLVGAIVLSLLSASSSTSGI